MKAHRTGLCTLAAAIAILALPPVSTATLVPPENSAATQYTEAFPTAGGPQGTGRGSHGGTRSPTKVLGAANTRKLDVQGAQGRATASAAAATAPSVVTPGKNEQHGARGGTRHASRSAAPSSSPGVPGGSSGFGEVIGQATGSSSSGELGLLMPIVIVAAITSSLVYLWRRRRHVF